MLKNPEANEISDEDLQAAAETYDRIVEGKATRAEMKQEAYERMKLLGLKINFMSQFTNYDQIPMVCQETNAYGAPTQSGMAFVKAFEEKYNSLVYYVTVDRYPFGLCLTMAYVSSEKSEWEDDRAMLKENRMYAYVENLDDSLCSEIGSISFKMSLGILYRTA